MSLACALALVSGSLTTAATTSQADPADVSHIDGFTPRHSSIELRHEDILMSAMDHKRADHDLRWLTKYPGEDATPGILRRQHYIVSKLRAAGLKVHVRTFYPYLAVTTQLVLA